MKLTDPIAVPEWLQRALPIGVAAALLWSALDFLSWQLGNVPALRGREILWDGGTQRCFDNVEPFMPIARLLHSLACPGGVPHAIVVACLFVSAIAVFLAARALSGWWSAGVAVAVAATSPFLFALVNQMSPAALGVIAGTLSCWFTVEAFGRGDSQYVRKWRMLWFATAAIALGLHVESAWLVLSEAAYALTRSISVRRPDLGVGVACATAALAIGTAFLPSDSTTAAIARADIRGAPAALFAFSYPDEWMSQPHFAATLSVIVVVILLSGAIVARRTALPYFVAAVFVEQFVAAALSVDALAKLTSVAYAVPIMALSIGAIAEAAIRRRPHMLAFVIPALVVAAQYAAFGRLPLMSYQAFDFDSAGATPVAAFTKGESVRLYHDRHHADYATVYGSLDGLVHGTERRTIAATTATAVTAVSPYRLYRGLYVVYAIAARDGSWSGFVGGDKLWREPGPRAIIQQPFAKVRLYDRPDVPYRGDSDSTLEPVDTRFEVLDVNGAAYQPELHVHVTDGPDAGREGWVYAQTLMLGPAAGVNR
ncbi:MAG TPA: hypothetical protein VFO25_10990 [Candidatus Eremiobacteraceae bacterium]|nr:hypothetical protein [Candidatus Eremiobacteraceae bacterium]